MDEVISQAPPDIPLEHIETIFNKNDKKVIPTLSELWNIVEKEKIRDKWDDIRETCDTFDMQMDKEFMSKMRKMCQASQVQ